MCGIAGIHNIRGYKDISKEQLRRMIGLLRHRGPDGFGFYCDQQTGFAHARLSIIDLEGGKQPMTNEDGTVWITFNGEIFNYIELRQDLEKKGHRFATNSDTEVIVHLYEDFGHECLQYLNGQFAFAIWDKFRERLFLARDRMGIRPLFYTTTSDQFLFASEIKALFAARGVKREMDLHALDQIFTFWTTIPPRTAFVGINELPAGHYLMMEKGAMVCERYWDPHFKPPDIVQSTEEYAEELRDLLIDATRLQLRADVPVGAYLSGGIDSSVITTLIKHYTDTPLRTFSVTFEDKVYDESGYQEQMIKYLGTDHSNIKCNHADIAGIFPDVIWHTEKPIVRTAPAPLFLLSKLVRDSGYRVVLTGEGSDEILAGYDIFKEAKIRRFLERDPESVFRPLILKKLYPYLANSPVKSVKYAEAFFMADSTYAETYNSHIPRWNTTARIKEFFSDPVKHALRNYANSTDLNLFFDSAMGKNDAVSFAQYIEIKLLLAGYLLSSQGDRVAMANSIEGRFPFLDHRVVEFACKLPPTVRMRALTEKYILKKSMQDLLPASIIKRTKQPYMAPDAKSFVSESVPEYVSELLSENALRESGYFNPTAVKALQKKCLQSKTLGFKDNMAFVGILSTQLIHNRFIQNFGEDLKTNRIQEMNNHAMQAGN